MDEFERKNIISKTFNCDDLFHVLVQYPIELTDIKKDDDTIVRKPITCFVSNKKIIPFNQENVTQLNEAKEKINSIYYITPNPKKIGGTDYLQTTILESHEDQIIRNLGLKLSMLIFRQVGLSKTPIYLYLTSDLRENVQWEADIFQILTAFKQSVKI